MKILHLCSQDYGGAGRATLRLHQALIKHGVDSLMLVQEKSSDLPSVECLAKTQAQKFFTSCRIAAQYIPTLYYKNREKDIFSCNTPLSNQKLIQRIKEINPDIIHLHWINNGFLKIGDLAKFNKPILWSLHDINPFTGGCHVIHPNCDKNKTHCQKCPQLQSKLKYDISYWTFYAKKKTYPKLNLTVNGLSSWIAQCAKESALFKDKPIINLPNVIDTSIYKPIDKNLARNLLGLNCEKKIIAFGAISGTQIPRKGYMKLKEALELLPNKNEYELVVFGSSYGEEIAGIKTHFLGHIYDDLTLCLIYNALDVFVTPSLAENLSNTIMESLSCGTPVVAFDIGGNKDLIQHLHNGFLAKNTKGLIEGILWVLKHQEYDKISQNSRNYVIKHFNETKACAYSEIYRKLINDKTKN